MTPAGDRQALAPYYEVDDAESETCDEWNEELDGETDAEAEQRIEDRLERLEYLRDEHEYD